MDSFRRLTALGGIARLVGENGHAINPSREAITECLPQLFRMRRFLSLSVCFARCHKATRVWSFASAKSRLQAYDPVSRLSASAQGSGYPAEYGRQSAGHKGLAEEFFRVEIDFRRRVLHDRPKVRGKHRLRKPPLANILMRRGHRIPGSKITHFRRLVPLLRNASAAAMNSSAQSETAWACFFDTCSSMP